jgi:hypothetical protein
VAVIPLTSATTQVRPWPAGGAWNNIVQNAQGTVLDTTTWGITLRPGQIGIALGAANQWVNVGAGTADRLAQERLHAVGLEIRDMVTLATAQAAGGVTANVLDRVELTGPATVDVITTVGATPTATYQIEGSLDNSAWSPLSSADSATPTVFSTATFTITTAGTTTRIVSPTAAWRYLRVTVSAVTNVTSTIVAAVV